jgi:hypothetical protein
MVRYFYAWTPLAFIGALVLLSLPWLALIALLVVSLVALPALAFAIVVAPYMLVQAINRRVHNRSSAGSQRAALQSPAARQPRFQKGYVA